ncbi:hypothetical protein ACVW0K_007308 [Streptomyces filamentosus]
MDVTIPGALADHLTAEPPFDLDTCASLTAARRGPGRTLVLTTTNPVSLHVISRRAEQLRTDSRATRAQKDAARTWIKRVGPAPQVVTVRFEDTETAYDASQCSTDLRHGDVLVAEQEKAVAVLSRAWPCAVTASHGEFHRPDRNPADADSSLAPSVCAAVVAAAALGSCLSPAIGAAFASTVTEEPAPAS